MKSTDNRRLHFGLAVEEAGCVTRKALFSLPLPRWAKREDVSDKSERAGTWYLLFLLALGPIIRAVQRWLGQ